MDFAAKIIEHTLAPCGRELVTVAATYPRFVHAELMTHRAFARNAASSRAIPFSKMVAMVREFPVIPIKFGREQKGMQTSDEEAPREDCVRTWLAGRDAACQAAIELSGHGVHKSLCNRLLEPFAWITTIITATEWNNFFRLRCHPDAEIHLQKIAYMMRDTIFASVPRPLQVGEWHLPFIQPDERELPIEQLLQIATARSARVSYLTHDGTRAIARDVEMYEKLCQGSGFGHWSPHEHVAQASDTEVKSGPFVGYTQYRKNFANENIPGLTRSVT